MSLSEHDKAVLNVIFNPNLPLSEAYEENLEGTVADEEEESENVIKSKSLEAEAIRAAEAGDLDSALTFLENALEICPHRASIYNNKAQIYQFKGQLEDAFSNLTKAIDLSTEKTKKTKCQALCQRGILHRKWGEVDLARDDFARAADLGSKFAKSQLVELNPYAALCNQMLRKVMSDLKQ